MAESYYFDPTHLPTYDAGTGSVILNAGKAFFGVTVYNGTAGQDAIHANGIQDITIIPGVTVYGQGDGIEFTATGIVAGTTNAPNTFYNQGFVSSATGAGVLFSGGGTNIVTNQGTISGVDGIKLVSKTPGAGDPAFKNRLEVLNTGTILASGKAIIGGSDDDKIVNSGLIRATGTEVAIALGAGNDIYEGNAGTVIGTIDLGEGDDRAVGGSGSEVFYGGAGSDYIDGGAGSDTVDYHDATSGISLNLNLTGEQNISDNHGKDILISIENVVGSSKSDYLTGNNSDNKLVGGDGDDVLFGGSGATSQDGNDIFDGGAGTDTVNYNGSTAVTVDLNINTIQNTGYGYDTLISIENVNGGNGSDTITGNAANNSLSGGAGNDNLTGGAGNDTLRGGDGNDTLDGSTDNDKVEGENGNDSLKGGIGLDTLIGGIGNDTLWGGDGNDTVEGNDGNDMAVFTGIRSAYTISVTTGDESTEYTVTHTIAGAGAGETVVGAGGVDSLKGIRVLKFLGDNHTEASDDELYAFSNSAAPTIVNLSGSGIKENSDVGTAVGVLSATDADGDALTYTLLSDAGGLFELDDDGKTIIVKKKEGLDYELHTTFTIKVRVSDGIKNLSDGTTMVGTAEKDVVIKVVNEADSTGPVTRIGTAASETLSGDNGSDLLKGMGGNDTLSGGIGDDRIYGGTGSDRLTGGFGKDRFYFDARPGASNIDHITDFNPTDDTIYLSRSIFKGVVTKAGYMKSSYFKVGNSFDSDDRFVYQPSSGGLFYDQDGARGPSKYVQVATLGENLRLTVKDLYFF